MLFLMHALWPAVMHRGSPHNFSLCYLAYQTPGLTSSTAEPPAVAILYTSLTR